MVLDEQKPSERQRGGIRILERIDLNERGEEMPPCLDVLITGRRMSV